MTVLEQVQAAKYLAVTFNEIGYPGPTRFAVCGSEDGINWDTIKEYDWGLRDPNLQKIGDWYYLIFTTGMKRTEDFENWEDLPFPTNGTDNWLWAPKFFQDKDGNWHIVFARKASNNSYSHLLVVDFDNGVVGTIEKPLTFADHTADGVIDPNITYFNGQYYLWVQGSQLLIAKDYLGPYQNAPLNFPVQRQDQSPTWVEGPFMVVDGDKVWLYADCTGPHFGREGLVYQTASIYDLTNWTEKQHINHPDWLMHHGGIIRQNTSLQLHLIQDNVWHIKICNNINAGYFTKQINELIDLLNGSYILRQELPHVLIPQISSGKLGRSFRLGLFASFDSLHDALSMICDALNVVGLFEKYQYPWRAPDNDVPRGLMLTHHYMDQIDSIWQQSDDLINQISAQMSTYKR